MDISHNRKLSSLVVPMMLLIVIGATSPVNAEQSLTIEVSRCVDIKSAVERLACYDEAKQPLIIEVSRCVDIKSAIERITCYDELAYQAQQADSKLEAADLSRPKSVTAAAVVQSAPVVKQVPVTDQTVNKAGRVTEENFGFPPDKQEDEEDLVELHSTVSKLKEMIPGRYLITLENGQVWQQTVGKRYQLRVGHNVRIYPTRWGDSFRLSAEGLKGYIQVDRVR